MIINVLIMLFISILCGRYLTKKHGKPMAWFFGILIFFVGVGLFDALGRGTVTADGIKALIVLAISVSSGIYVSKKYGKKWGWLTGLFAFIFAGITLLPATGGPSKSISSSSSKEKLSASVKNIDGDTITMMSQDSISAKLSLESLFMDIETALKKLRSDYVTMPGPVGSQDKWWTFRLESKVLNQYGQESTAPILFMTFNMKEINKINFDNMGPYQVLNFAEVISEKAPAKQAINEFCAEHSKYASTFCAKILQKRLQRY